MGSSTDHSNSSATEPHDPCGEFGPTQRWALVWFFSVIAIGAGASYTLCQIDATMFATNAEFFDYTKYKDNRFSSIRIKSDGFDERAHSTLIDAKRALLAKNESPAQASAAAHAEPAAESHAAPAAEDAAAANGAEPPPPAEGAAEAPAAEAPVAVH